MPFPTYPAYQETHIPWLGKVPAHWRLERLKHRLQRIYTGGTPTPRHPPFWSAGGEGIPWVSISDISQSKGLIQATKKRITPAGQAAKKLTLVPRGTVLVTIFASIGKVAQLAIEATLNQAIIGLVGKQDLCALYLFYWLKDASRYVEVFSSHSTQSNLSISKIKQLVCAFPPLGEQKVLAGYLEEKSAQIDKKIARLKQQEAHYQALWESLLLQAVTQGLPPGQARKASASSPLGQIAAHWQAVRLKQVAHLRSGYAFKASWHTPGGIPLVKMSHLKAGQIQRGPCDQQVQACPAYAPFLLQEGELLLGLSGSLESFARVEKKDLPSYLNQRVAAVRAQAAQSNDFLYWFIQSPLFKRQVTFFSAGSTIANLGHTALGQCLIALPPLAEQKSIAAYLAKKQAQLSVLRNGLAQQVAYLQALKTSLIHEVVTGQIAPGGSPQAR